MAGPDRGGGARRGGLRPAWVGEKAHAIEEAVQVRIAFITRLGDAMLAGPGTVLQEGDVLYVVTAESELERISEAFARINPGGRSHGKGAH